MEDINSEYPVDLQHLRDITDGEKDVEAELFSLFFSNAEECVAVLEKNTGDGENLQWRSASHELKGSAASLGAFKLSKFCHQGQMIFAGTEAEKKVVLQHIKDGIVEVKQFLETLSYS